jgi:uncharacterized protein YjbI with pentapeptide repeats
MSAYSKILVDGIGRRKRYWLSVGSKTFGPFFHLDALLRAINTYSGQWNDFTMDQLRACFDEDWKPYRPFVIEFTGKPIEPHRAEHRRKSPTPQPPQPPVSQELAELLDALGPTRPTPPAIQRLKAALGVSRDGHRRADIQLREADLAGLSMLPYFDPEVPCLSLDPSGDYSWSNLSGSRLTSGRFRPRKGYPVILSGWFIGTNLSNCRFERAHLAGDFSGADFSGAEFRKCKLSGRFNRALMPVNLHGCEISPDASFKGADLRGANAHFPEPDQIQAAQFNLLDKVTVGNGSAVKIHGTKCELRRPAQLLPNVITPERSYGSCRGSMLPLAVVEFSGTYDERWLYDVSKADSENLAGWSVETSRHRSGHGHFYLNAPDATLRGIMAQSPDSRVFLRGNFDRARLIESKIRWLELRAGSFRDFDLTRAVVDLLWLHVSNADLKGILLPDAVRGVCFQSDYRDCEFRFQTLPSQAGEIIEAWNCRQKCAALAERYLAAMQAFSDDEVQRIRKFRSCTVDEGSRAKRFADQQAQASTIQTVGGGRVKPRKRG